jgi:hypothetical protein
MSTKLWNWVDVILKRGERFHELDKAVVRFVPAPKYTGVDYGKVINRKVWKVF